MQALVIIGGAGQEICITIPVPTLPTVLYNMVNLIFNDKKKKKKKNYPFSMKHLRVLYSKQTRGSFQPC